MAVDMSERNCPLSAHIGGTTSQDILEDIDGHIHGPFDGFFQKYFSSLQDILDTTLLLTAAETLRSQRSRPTTDDALPSGEDFLKWLLTFTSQRPAGTRGTWHTCCYEVLTAEHSRVSAHIVLTSSLKAPDLATENGWLDVQVIGQLVCGPSAGYRAGLLALWGHAREVFASQPTRLFLHGFYIHGPLMELWVFDRSGIYSGGSIDMYWEPQTVVSCLLGYQSMSSKDLGEGTILENDSFGRFVTLDNVALPGRSKLYLEDNPISLSRELIGAGTACYKAKTAGQGQWGELLKLVKEKSVWGVVSLDYHQELKRTTDMHRGLLYGPCRKLTDGGGATSRNEHISRTSNLAHGEPESTAHHTEETDKTLVDRIFTCLAISPAGRPLRTSTSAFELLQVFRDAVKAHPSLLQDAQILHQDVSAENIIFSDDEGEGKPKGLLIDLDVALNLAAGPRTPGDVTGTRPFMAIGILKRRHHTYRHDLESFLYVFLWTVISNGSPNPPRTSRLRGWSRGTWDESAARKTSEMSEENFEAILAEFPSELGSLKTVAVTLREILFPLENGAIWTGTDSLAVDSLYDQMIAAFDVATMLR